MLRFFTLVMFVTFSYASYNPFFSEPVKQPKEPQKPKKSVKKVYIQPPVLKLDLTYYGYIQTQNKNYALLEMDTKSFAISEGDSFYVKNQKIDVIKINSNQVVVKNSSSYQTHYFSRNK